MPGYVIASYTVNNEDEYQQYLAGVAPILERHGAEPVVADFSTEVREGPAGQITVVMKFPSKEAARAWYEDPDYQAIRHHRAEHSEGLLVIADGFIPPT